MSTSTIVAALPAWNDPVQTLGSTQKHATVLFFGEISDEEAALVRAAVEQAQNSFEPFKQNTSSVEGLGEDEPQAVVLKLNPDSEGSSLANVREKLLEHPGVRELWSRIDQYPSFTPHVTLGYGEDVSDEDRSAASLLNDVSFDRLAVWHRDEQTEYPLDDVRLESVTAGVRFVRTAEGAAHFKVPVGSKIEVGSNGKVQVISQPKNAQPAPAPVKPVDPSRTPKKFVATVPGQQAKLPEAASSVSSSESGDTHSPQARGAKKTASSARRRLAVASRMRQLRARQS